MTRSKAAKRPPIHMIDTDADALTSLAVSAEDRCLEVSGLLTEEIARARIDPASKIPADMVTLYARVEFVDEGSGSIKTVQIVLPREADIAQGRISILTPVGAGLIGLREGQSMLWSDRDDHERRLAIVKARQDFRRHAARPRGHTT